MQPTAPTTRILIVDDNDRVRDAMCLRIGLCRPSDLVDGVRGGEEALARLAETEYDIVLCDLVLAGGMDGIAVARAIHERRPEVRVIVFTGNETGERKIEVLRAGAFSYLAKPINYDELLHAIETIDSIRRTERLERRFRALARLSHDLQTSFDLDWLAHKIVDGAQILGYGRARLYLIDGDGDAALVGKAAFGHDGATFEDTPIPAGARPMVEEIFADPRPRLWTATEIVERFGAAAAAGWVERLGLAGLSWVDLPLTAGKERIGVLAVDDPRRPDLPGSAEEIELLDVFAGLAAQALANARRYEKEALANASLSSFLRDAPDAVVTTDLEGTITFVSPSSETLMGRAASRMVGQPAAAFYVDESGAAESGREIAKRIMARLRSDGVVSNERVALLTADGPRPASLSVSLLHDERGEPIGTLAIAKDLGALEAQSRQYRDLLEGFGYGTLFLNKEGVIRFINRKAERFLKRRREEAEGARFVDMVLAGQRGAFTEGFRAAIDERREAQLDLSLLRADDGRLAVKARLTPVRGQGGVTSGVAVALYDKSELKALIQSGRLMALGQMVAGVAHEINNPLNNMVVTIRELGYRLERSGRLEDKERGYLDIVERNAERIRSIVVRLRDFARPGKFRREPLDLNAVLRDSVSFFEDRFRHHGIAIEMRLAEDLPRVPGDGTRLQQVFVNLIVNAEEAMEGQAEPKEIHLATRRLETGRVEVRVRDTGSGIPDEVADAIFDPFFTTKAPNKGTGLGLSISRSILEMHEGTIEIVKMPERGTCFRLELPVDVDLGTNDEDDEDDEDVTRDGQAA